MNDIERKGLIDQIRREDYQEFQKYQIGKVTNGAIIAFKDFELTHIDGIMLIVPTDFFDKVD